MNRSSSCFSLKLLLLSIGLSAVPCKAYEVATGSGHALATVTGCQAGTFDCAYSIPQEQWSNLDVKPTQCSAYSSSHEDTAGSSGILIVSAIVAMVMAFAIGGNDSANAWGTSVGSGAISLRKACLLGGFSEFLGATLLGAGVSGTIQKGVASVVDEDCWACGYCDSKMALYQWGMFSALTGAAFFLVLVTIYSMPVSTTHAIVGGVAGMTVTAIGGGCLNWKLSGGLGGIVLSWVLSPLLAGVIGSLMFILTYFVVFKAKNPKIAACRLVPVLYGLTTSGLVYITLKKSALTKDAVSAGHRFLIFACLLIATPVIVHFSVMPRVLKDVEEYEANLAQGTNDVANQVQAGDAEMIDEVVIDVVPTERQEAAGQAEAANEDSLPKDESQALDKPEGMHLCEQSNPTREQLAAKKVFQSLLVFTAVIESFAHGANDTANATGPFGAIWNTYNEGVYACDNTETPWYIMAIAGFFVCLGMNIMGYRVIKTVGEDLTNIDFHIGYCVEFAATFSVMVATLFGMPVSTTHCKIGALVFVGGLASGWRNVAWGMFGKIALSWAVTLPLSGGVSAMMLFFRYAKISS
eukprot:TRINITY_DN19047_c0_g1_i1.p1 TRINITY_DN19047_c0_g1~~TRINITY_DN19047_c0_g1_i1.p1  ORF type:complete len:580 (+),score=82.71 TRINITY_DN19047_c0_g1_i1:64-1803(+)